MDTIVYLLLCEFTIAIRLQKSWNPNRRKVFKDNFIKEFNPVIVTRPKNLPDFTVSISDINWSNITPVKKKDGYFFCLYNEKNNKEMTTHYFISLGLLKVLLIHALQNLIIRSQGVMIHASSSIINNKADIFCGVSGAGKSTTISLLRDNYKGFAGDKMFAIKKSGTFFAYQMPFLEREDWITRGQKPYLIGRVFFLIKSKKDRLEKIESKITAFEEFMKRYDSMKPAFKKDFRVIFDIINTHDCYYLYFSKNKRKLVQLLGSKEASQR